VLLVMMAVKFSIVAMYFMHLKFDDALFTKVFTAGIVLAVGVYLIALTSFHYFAS
jgi:cytochrome c oxidase subunit 4